MSIYLLARAMPDGKEPRQRRCLGAGFAQSQIKLVLATMLKEYELKIANNKPIKAIRHGLSMIPQQDFQRQIVKKLNV